MNNKFHVPVQLSTLCRTIWIHSNYTTVCHLEVIINTVPNSDGKLQLI